MNLREVIFGVGLLCQFTGKALVKNAPDKSLWWIGSTLDDIGTPMMASLLMRDTRSKKKPEPPKDA